MAHHDHGREDTPDGGGPGDRAGGRRPTGRNLAAHLPARERDRFIEALDEAVNGPRELGGVPDPDALRSTEPTAAPGRRRTRRSRRRRIGR